MRTLLTHGSNSFSKLSGRFQNTLTCWVVLLIILDRMPPTASEEVDCRELSGYTSGPVPDMCTVQLDLNDTETKIINSLRAKYHDFPIRCRLGKYSDIFHGFLTRGCFCFSFVNYCGRPYDSKDRPLCFAADVRFFLFSTRNLGSPMADCRQTFPHIRK